MEILPRFLIQYPMKNLIGNFQSQCQKPRYIIINLLRKNSFSYFPSVRISEFQNGNQPCNSFFIHVMNIAFCRQSNGS